MEGAFQRFVFEKGDFPLSRTCQNYARNLKFGR